MSQKVIPISTIHEHIDIDDWTCFNCSCEDRVYEGRKTRQVKRIFRIIGATLFLIFSSLLYGEIILMIVRDKTPDFTPLEVCFSIIIGWIFILLSLYTSNYCCCRDTKLSIFEIFCS